MTYKLNDVGDTKYPFINLSEVLNQNKDYISELESKQYPKLSVKLYGKGVVLDTPADGSTVKMKKHQIAKVGQIILSEIWGKKGAIGFVPKEGEGALCTSHFFLFSVDKEKILPSYLEVIFRSNYLLPQLDNLAKGTTGYAAIRPNQFLNCVIPYPNILKQQYLVKKINTLFSKLDYFKDAKIEINNKIEAFLVSLLYHKYLEMSNKYQEQSLDTLTSMTSGKNLISSKLADEYPYPVYGGGGYIGRYFEYIVDDPTIVIGRVGARCGCVFISQEKAWITDNAIYLKNISPKLDQNYLKNALINLNLRKFAREAAQPVISQKNIKSHSIPVPPIDVQKKSVTQINTLQKYLVNVQSTQAEQENRCEQLLQSFLDGAFKGKY